MHLSPADRVRELSTRGFSSGWVGRVSYLIFHWRRLLLGLGIAVTLALGWSATHLKVDAGFEKMIPLHHEYMKTLLRYRETFGGANKIVVAVKNHRGTIYDKAFMETLRAVSDEVFFLDGVERASVLSLFSPNVRYTEVVEDGFRGGTVIDAGFDGSDEHLKRVRENVLKSDWVGRIVATDHTAALVVANLLEGRADLQDIAHRLEDIRTRHQTDAITLHEIGFAKAVGDLADGAAGVIGFFAVAFAVTALLLYWYSGSVMLSVCALVCAMVPVVWLLGLLPLLGMGIDPMSILVPFLIFSIGVSHAVQMTNAWKLECLNGETSVAASRNAFQKLFIPGAMALLANALGFLVIALVDIDVVRELAFTATLGVTVMILTNKLLLPVLLSFMTLSPAEARRLGGKETAGDRIWEKVAPLAERRNARWVLLLAAVMAGLGLWQARDLKIGDLGKGMPELRAESRYNRDIEMITSHFAIGVDTLQVVVEARGGESPCVDRAVMDRIEGFEFAMRQTEGVASVRGLVGFVKSVTQGFAETSIKWRVLPEERAQIGQGVGYARRMGNELMNTDCSAMPVTVYPRDHQAETIERIIARIRDFKRDNDSAGLTFRLASGNVGVMAATNEAVAAADKWVNLTLFASVGLLCLLTFRSWRVTACIVVPLGIVTVLCNALMAGLGIGVKVNTLPVVALGVGVGVDYGIYLFERMKHEMHERGRTLRQAFAIALKQRGTASVFTAVTMTVSVATWAFSALKFQADMGILLAFMFLVNMLGAIFLLPAFAAFLVGDGEAGKG